VDRRERRCFEIEPFLRIPFQPLLPIALLLATATGCAPLGRRFDPRAKPGMEKHGVGDAAFQQVSLHALLPAGALLRPTELFRLGVGDLVEIEQLGFPNTLQLCRVMPDGMLYYHTAAGMKVTGLTLPDLKTQIESALREYYRNPQVSIILRNVSSQRIWVMGRVNTPGLYPLAGPTTVLEAIARAGGLFASRFSGTTEELADLRHSFVVRNGEYVPVDFLKLLRNGDLSQNIYLKGGDYVYLPSVLNSEVYVMGAVYSPRAVGFMDQVTLLSAISAAKGLLPGAYAQRAVIVRGSLVEPSVATVNVNRIMMGKDPDVALEPRDIVWIPNSPWDRVETYAKMAMNTFTRTVAANQGAHTASSQSGPVQPNIPISSPQ